MEKKKQINLKISEELYLELESYSNSESQTITRSIVIAIKNLINENSNLKVKNTIIMTNGLFAKLKTLGVDIENKEIHSFIEKLHIDDTTKLMRCVIKYSKEGRPDIIRKLPGFLKWAEWNLGIY